PSASASCLLRRQAVPVRARNAPSVPACLAACSSARSSGSSSFRCSLCSWRPSSTESTGVRSRPPITTAITGRIRMPDSGSRTSAERAAASAQPGGARAAVADCDRSHALIRETLLQVARQRELLDPHACGALFTLIETGRAIRRYLASVILELGLTEAKFCALTILHRLDPQSSTAAELAYHSGVSRSAMTDIIDQMVAQGLVKRERSSTDRRTVHITLSE